MGENSPEMGAGIACRSWAQIKSVWIVVLLALVEAAAARKRQLQYTGDSDRRFFFSSFSFSSFSFFTPFSDTRRRSFTASFFTPTFFDSSFSFSSFSSFGNSFGFFAGGDEMDGGIMALIIVTRIIFVVVAAAVAICRHCRNSGRVGCGGGGATQPQVVIVDPVVAVVQPVEPVAIVDPAQSNVIYGDTTKAESVPPPPPPPPQGGVPMAAAPVAFIQPPIQPGMVQPNQPPPPYHPGMVQPNQPPPGMVQPNQPPPGMVQPNQPPPAMGATKFCAGCGTPLDAGTKFCSGCGTPVN